MVETDLMYAFVKNENFKFKICRRIILGGSREDCVPKNLN